MSGLAAPYTFSVDYRTAREVLRRARQRQQPAMSLDAAAKKTGLNRATIHSIENIKREPNLQPELETIERLVVAYGMTLSSFFLQIEGLQNPKVQTHDALPSAEQADHATPSLAPAMSFDLAPFEAFGAALGRSLGEQLAERERKRKDSARARKKSSRGRDNRGDARRRG